MGLTGPRWAPCWPHELCYLGCAWVMVGIKLHRFVWLNHRSITTKFVTPTALAHCSIVYMDNSWRSTTLCPPKKLTSSTADLEWCHVHSIRQGVQRSGKSQGNSIPGKSQGIVREFCYGSGKIKNVGKSQGKVREFWTGHGYGGFMSNLKHFGQHPHSLLMELLTSVTWMSNSYDSLDISLMSGKLIYNFPNNYTWKLFYDI